jgi:hypothetical protein
MRGVEAFAGFGAIGPDLAMKSRRGKPGGSRHWCAGGDHIEIPSRLPYLIDNIIVI